MVSNQPFDHSGKNLLKLTTPVILLLLSSSAMMLSDRLILAKSSVNAMNAVSITSNLLAVIINFINTLIITSEAFVGQYNGAKKYKSLAEPTWQMIYFALISCLIFWPLAYFSDVLNYLPKSFYQDGVTYQRIMLIFGFLQGIACALAGFFIGQGKAYIAAFATILGALVNFILDLFLVGKLAWSTQGVAVANISAFTVQILWMASYFFNQENRNNFDTLSNWHFRPKLATAILRTGLPTAIGASLLFLSRWIIQSLIGHASLLQSTLYNLTITFYLIALFLAEALNRTMATVAANLISQNDLSGIRLVYHRFLVLITLFVLFLSLLSLIFARPILEALISVQHEFNNIPKEIFITFIFLFLNIWLESAYKITLGMLMAGGDTRYPIIVNFASTALINLIPCFWLFSKGRLNSTSTILQFNALYSLILLALYYWRYRSLKWYHSLIK